VASKLNEQPDPNGRSLAKLAGETEARWRSARGLTKQLNRDGNAEAMRRRQRVSNPKEPKGAGKHRRCQDKKLGRMGAASKVRHIDPVTGKERL
jgi:hypothetical protein